jgi:hypothetical protein
MTVPETAALASPLKTAATPPRWERRDWLNNAGFVIVGLFVVVRVCAPAYWRPAEVESRRLRRLSTS